MKYYRVKTQYDGRMLNNGKSLIANELFTETEVVMNKIPSVCLEPVKISKKKIFKSFGARFEINE